MKNKWKIRPYLMGDQIHSGNEIEATLELW